MRFRNTFLAAAVSILALGGVVAATPAASASPRSSETVTPFKGQISYYNLNFILDGRVTIANGRYSVSGSLEPFDPNGGATSTACVEGGNPYVKVRLNGETDNGTRWVKPRWNGFRWVDEWWNVSRDNEYCSELVGNSLYISREGTWDPDDKKIILDVCLWYSAWNGWYCDSPNLYIEPTVAPPRPPR